MRSRTIHIASSRQLHFALGAGIGRELICKLLPDATMFLLNVWSAGGAEVIGQLVKFCEFGTHLFTTSTWGLPSRSTVVAALSC
jgi:hypothetical protein